MSVTVKLGRSQQVIGIDFEYAEELAWREFTEDLDPQIVAWLQQRNIPLEPFVHAVDFEMDRGDAIIDVAVGLEFDDPNMAMLFKLTFGGV